MKIIINENPIDYKVVLPTTWEELLSHMLRNYIDKKHGITNILVDNTDSIEVMIETPKKLISKDIKCIEITTKDSKTIAKIGLEKISKIISKLKSDSILTADLYREGKIKEASQNLVIIIHTISPIIFFVNSIEKNFNFDFSEIFFISNTTIKEKINYFSNSFTELVEIQEKNDFIELADFLEYQLTDDLNDWVKIISILKNEVENSSTKPN